ncbi:MAG: acetylxylan esterase [Candidatus Bathyarchaeia archaeon]
MKGLPEDLLRREPIVEWRGVIETRWGYRIRKLRYEGFPDMWIPALLYEPSELDGKVPGVLNATGHHPGGKAMTYTQARCINLAKRGMLALSMEFIGMGELSANVDHGRIGHLDLCGVAGVAVFYLAMKRGLDVLLSHPHCDPDRIAMTGLSGGGWQTAVLSALDERIKVIIPVAGYSPLWQRPSCMGDIGDLEQNPVDICTVGDYDALTALFAPRPTLLIYNKYDECCFRSDRTKISVYEPVRPLFELLGVSDHIEFYENVDPGTHNYEADNRSQLYRFLNKHFRLNTPEVDLPYEEELMSESQLEVGLPENNATLLSLAKEAVKGLPSSRVPRGSEDQLAIWISEARQRLRNIIRLRQFNVRDEIILEEDIAIHHRLHMDEIWTIPVMELHVTDEKQSSPSTWRETSATEVQVLLSDFGRRSLAQLSEAHLNKGCRVFTADVFGTGESCYPNNLQMMLSAVGERPLGILTGQILSLLKWVVSYNRVERVRLAAVGPITSFASLCAAALEPKILSHLYIDGLYDSLKRLIELPVNYDTAVPLFCFGLLKEIDILELMVMTEELPIERPGHGPVKPVIASNP